MTGVVCDFAVNYLSHVVTYDVTITGAFVWVGSNVLPSQSAHSALCMPSSLLTCHWPSLNLHRYYTDFGHGAVVQASYRRTIHP